MVIKVEHPNGYAGVLYGKSSMAIYDKDGHEVLHTGFRTPNTKEELYETLEDMPRVAEMIAQIIKADRKTENSSEISNNSTISKMEQVDEPKICDTCRYYNSNIPCGSTPSACKKADKFADEFVDGLKKLKPQTERSE